MSRGRAGVAVLLLVLAACGGGADDDAPVAAGCDWPMFGLGPERTFATECPTGIAPDTAERLVPAWRHRTRDVVTATPAVADGTVFVGDWSGRFYALDLEDGSERWIFDAPPHEQVYAGQIVASAAVAEADAEQRVFFASGKTLYALRARDGRERWRHELGRPGDGTDPTEIQSSPVVADGLVIFGFDGHDEPGVRAGIVALDAASGEQRWTFDPDEGRPASGCAGVWSSPAVDVARGLVFAGSANCPSSPEGWNRYSEAIFAVGLDDGRPRWSFQPRGPSNSDFDFAGAPNLFRRDGRDLVGLGGKDGNYYALDRDSGEVAWRTRVAEARVQASNFSTGGFIGATAVADGRIVGGTAIDSGCPCLHALDAGTGAIAWQQNAAGATFAASAIANGVAFSGSTTDFTLRAVDLDSGAVLWSYEMPGGVAGGPVVVGDTLVAVAGIREPGVDPAGVDAGVFAFRLGTGPAPTSVAATGAGDTLPPTVVAPPPVAVASDLPATPRCIGRPCELSFSLKAPPSGTRPVATLWLTPDPYRLEVRAEDLGDPGAWLRPGTAAAEKGAVTFAVFGSDDALRGTLLCILDAAFDCVADTLPTGTRPSYNRINILAIANTTRLPSPAEGFDRLVTTVSLESPVTLGPS